MVEGSYYHGEVTTQWLICLPMAAKRIEIKKIRKREKKRDR